MTLSQVFILKEESFLYRRRKNMTKKTASGMPLSRQQNPIPSVVRARQRYERESFGWKYKKKKNVNLEVLQNAAL